MEGVQTLPPHQQQEFMKVLEQMQMKDSLSWVARLDADCQSEKRRKPYISILYQILTACTRLLYNSMYNNLVERCFDGCVTSFRSKTMSKSESSCVENCASRYIKMTQRVGLRFAEHQAMQQKRAADAAVAEGN